MEPDVPHRQGKPLMGPPRVYPLLYNGPVNYYARLIRERQLFLEQSDHFSKQTYRNRCNILGPNGIITLSVPVKRKRGLKTIFRDIRIDYDHPWNKVHWKSLEAAYASSPYFEIAASEYQKIYEGTPEFLVDLNIGLMETTLRILDLDTELILNQEFTEISTSDDPRYFIHPKKDLITHDPLFTVIPYHQVFSKRHGFQSNLSILDVIFNKGPESLSILKKSLRT